MGDPRPRTDHGDERDLVARAREGDPEAVAALYEAHYGAIFRYLWLRTGSEALAEELTAEVFVRMVEHLPRYRDRGRPFLAWLYTIARNLLTDHRRREGRVEVVPLENLSLRSGHDPEGEALRALDRDCLRRGLSGLTEAQRRVILHRFLEGRSLKETAELLGKPVGAVKALQHRALASLRRRLEAERCF